MGFLEARPYSTCHHSPTYLLLSILSNPAKHIFIFELFFHFSMIKIFSMICMFCVKVNQNNTTIMTVTTKESYHQPPRWWDIQHQSQSCRARCATSRSHSHSSAAFSSTSSYPTLDTESTFSNPQCNAILIQKLCYQCLFPPNWLPPFPNTCILEKYMYCNP